MNRTEIKDWEKGQRVQLTALSRSVEAFPGVNSVSHIDCCLITIQPSMDKSHLVKLGLAVPGFKPRAPCLPGKVLYHELYLHFVFLRQGPAMQSKLVFDHSPLHPPALVQTSSTLSGEMPAGSDLLMYVNLRTPLLWTVSFIPNWPITTQRRMTLNLCSYFSRFFCF